MKVLRRVAVLCLGYLCATAFPTAAAAADDQPTPVTPGSQDGTRASTTTPRMRLEDEGESQPLTLSLVDDSEKRPVVMLHPSGNGRPRDDPMPRTQQMVTGAEVPFLTAPQAKDESHSAGGADTAEEEVLHAGHSPSDQQLLYKDIFKYYNKHIRPILSHDDVMTIHFEIALFNVLNLDSKAGIMVTNTEVIMIWHDPYLTWDPEYYNHTSVMRVPYDLVWHPDVILYNTADKNYDGSLIYTNVIVNADGTVKLLIHAIFTSTCDIDIQWFPFDQQSCEMIFSSWTSDVNQLELEMGPSDITRYHPNHEFFLENFWSEMKEEKDPCCEHPFSMVIYHVQLQRRVKFALFFFIIPGVLINICALLVFSLPAETGEKVGLGINSMLAMMVFLMAMTENLPPTETLPLAGVYYGVCLIVLTCNIAFSVYVLNLSYSGDRGHHIPYWVKLESGDNGCCVADDFQRRSVQALESIRQHMEEQTMHYEETQRKTGLVEEWKFLSRVLDRILFILFGITTFLFNVIILTQSPFGEKFEYCPLGPGLCADGYSFGSGAGFGAAGGGGMGGGH
ncbi:neuronal acetylcholine receptor subunit alpha-10-like [Penaeus japonicus]|uniref:neuronal acetylcholine receptor subunit alpha-10-like n=1 Tax=Penaeus japonicus TaxID=27405 RepID=UPI001C715328|nr:neuronal acetylcholine receptor subunit alpha-10-like [Penaeus japonicus]